MRIWRSRMPPEWLAAGGLKIHFMCCLRRGCWMSLPCIFVRASFSSFSAPKTFVLLYFICTGTIGPRLGTKRRSARRRLWVSSDAATSVCTARQARHANKKPQRLCSFLSCLTIKGPKRSTPMCVNGGVSLHFSGGRSTLFWLDTGILNLRYVTHSAIILGTDAFPWMTQ